MVSLGEGRRPTSSRVEWEGLGQRQCIFRELATNPGILEEADVANTSEDVLPRVKKAGGRGDADFDGAGGESGRRTWSKMCLSR